MRGMLEKIIADRKTRSAFDAFQIALHYPEFGLDQCMDWDNEARTAIEGINSKQMGGIDRSSNSMWRTKEY